MQKFINPNERLLPMAIAPKRNLLKGRDRCLCGLRTTLHFTPDNRKLSCDEARAAHTHASIRTFTLRELLKGSAHRCTTTLCYPVCSIKAVS